MIQIELDLLKTAEQNIFDHMSEGDSIVHQFEVVPFDYRVLNRATPVFYITNYSLYFVYDDLMELFTLSELEMDILGEAPKFSPWQLWFEGKSYYSEAQGESFLKLKTATYYSRLSFNEKGQVPKEFALREGPNVGYSYQSWAMAQLLINTKNGLQLDTRLQELFKGNFAKYNKTTIGTFVGVLVGYVLLKGLLGGLATAIGIILDILFGGFSAFMLWWIYKSMEKNLKRFKVVYDGYAVSYTKAFDGSVKESDGKLKSIPNNIKVQTSSPALTKKEQGLKEQADDKKLVEALSVISELNKEEIESHEAKDPTPLQGVVQQAQSLTESTQPVAQAQTTTIPTQQVTQAQTTNQVQQQVTGMQSTVQNNSQSTSLNNSQQIIQQQIIQQRVQRDPQNAESKPTSQSIDDKQLSSKQHAYKVKLQPNLQKQPVYQAPNQAVTQTSVSKPQQTVQTQTTSNSNSNQAQTTSINPNIVNTAPPLNVNKPNSLIQQNVTKQPTISQNPPIKL